MYLLRIKAQGSISPFGWALMIAGGYPRDEKSQLLRSNSVKVDIPNMHIIGSRDTWTLENGFDQGMQDCKMPEKVVVPAASHDASELWADAASMTQIAKFVARHASFC